MLEIREFQMKVSKIFVFPQRRETVSSGPHDQITRYIFGSIKRYSKNFSLTIGIFFLSLYGIAGSGSTAIYPLIGFMVILLWWLRRRIPVLVRASVFFYATSVIFLISGLYGAWSTTEFQLKGVIGLILGGIVFLITSNVSWHHQWIQSLRIVLYVHLVCFYVQFVNYFLTNSYIDYMKFFDESYSSRVLFNSAFYSISSFVRFSGLFPESAIYCYFVFMVLAILLIKDTFGTPNVVYFFAIASLLLSFSIAGFILFVPLTSLVLYKIKLVNGTNNQVNSALAKIMTRRVDPGQTRWVPARARYSKAYLRRPLLVNVILSIFVVVSMIVFGTQFVVKDTMLFYLVARFSQLLEDPSGTARYITAFQDVFLDNSSMGILFGSGAGNYDGFSVSNSYADIIKIFGILGFILFFIIIFIYSSKRTSLFAVLAILASLLQGYFLTTLFWWFFVSLLLNDRSRGMRIHLVLAHSRLARSKI